MHTSPSAAAAAAVTHKLQRRGGHGDGGRRWGGGGGGTRPPLPRRPPLTWLSTSYNVAAAAVTAAVDAVFATARVHLSCGGRSCRKRPHAPVPRRPPLPRLRTGCDVAAAAVTAGAGDLTLSWPVGTAVVPAAGAAMLCVGAAAKLLAASRAEGTALRGAWVRRRWHRAVHGMSAQTSCIGKKRPCPTGKKFHVLLQPAPLQLPEAPESHSNTRHKKQSRTKRQHNT